MKRFFWCLLVLSAASLAAKYIAENFVITTGEGDPGFVQFDPSGFGMDDVAVALTFGLVSCIAITFFGPHR